MEPTDDAVMSVIETHGNRPYTANATQGALERPTYGGVYPNTQIGHDADDAAPLSLTTGGVQQPLLLKDNPVDSRSNSNSINSTFEPDRQQQQTKTKRHTYWVRGRPMRRNSEGLKGAAAAALWRTARAAVVFGLIVSVCVLFRDDAAGPASHPLPADAPSSATELGHSIGTTAASSGIVARHLRHQEPGELVRAIATDSNQQPQQQAQPQTATDAAAELTTVDAERPRRRLESNSYPDDLLIKKPWEDTKEEDKWKIMFHIIGVFFMFIGLSVVCDEYFCEALNRMVDHWKIKEDVAGATFMAAGGSAPELFTSIMGVFVAKSDVGFGTIVGSAVFNVLFVIGLCAVFSVTVLDLTWWPLFRDCTYYIFGLGTLAAFAADQKIESYEACILFVEYLGYVTIMYFNEQLEKWVKSVVRKFSRKVQPDSIPDNIEALDEQSRQKVARALKVMTLMRHEVWRSAMHGGLSPAGQKMLSSMKKAKAGKGKMKLTAKLILNNITEKREEQKRAVNQLLQKARSMDSVATSEHSSNGTATTEDEEEEDDYNPFEWPDNTRGRIIFIISLPIVFSLWLTLPNCAREDRKHLFGVTFGLSLVWIAIFSYFMVWWASIVGAVLGIPETIMGLTFLAAGTSIPDALSSVIMARQGEGDMAVSSSIGSNVFDILVGLPIPWMIQTLAVDPLGSLSFQSKYVVVQVLLLLMMVAFVVLSIILTKWKLDRKLGGVMGALYVVFLVVSVYLENWQPKWARI